MQDKLPLPQAKDALTLLEQLSTRAKRQGDRPSPPSLPLPTPEQYHPLRAKAEPAARTLAISTPPELPKPGLPKPGRQLPSTPQVPEDVRTRFTQVNWARERHKAPVIQLPVTTSARFAQVNWTRQAQPNRAQAPPVLTSLKPDPRQTESSTVQSVDSFFSDIQW